MIYKRHYLQFNDLVFDEYDMIAEDDASASFKTSGTSYGFGHGGYYPLKGMYNFVESSRVSLTVTLRMKKLPCDMRKFYGRFVRQELTKNGKLWAVQDNTLVWAFAIPSGVNQSLRARTDTLEYDIDFILPEGIWHKADKLRTFLEEFDKCDFMECLGMKDLNPCLTNGCCNCFGTNVDASCDCCDCIEKDMALCYHMDEIQDFYKCDNPYRILYSCEMAEKYFGDFYGSENLGQKICSDCGPITGKIYSDTDMPTRGVRITLHGKFTNPWIEINDNANTILGEYDGTLVINDNGSVYYTGDGCCDELIPVENWVRPDEMDYGWTINPGNNRVRIEGGDCCQTNCVYIEVDAITI